MNLFRFFLAGSLVFAVGQVAADEDGTRSFIEEIIVTAEKRAESEMTVPLAVTAFDDTKIEKLNIQNISDLSLMTPGLEVRADGANNLFTMRGVGTPYSSRHMSESAVAIYQNGLAALASVSAGIDTGGFDIERIEVLRGPQNTVYGRNSMGGTINYIRKTPQQEFGVDVLSELTTNNGYRLGVAVTGPLSESIAYRLTAYRHERDGFMKNVSDKAPDDQICDIGACTGDDLDNVDTFTYNPQIEIKRDSWKLNVSATKYDKSRIMGRNDVGPFPEGSLPAGLTWPTHVDDPGEYLGSFYGWDHRFREGEVQMNRDPIHHERGQQWVITFDWDINDKAALRYQRGRSTHEYEKYQDRDDTDRVGEAGDPPRERGTGFYFRDRLSTSEGNYFVNQEELTLDVAPTDDLRFRVGYYDYHGSRTGFFDRKYYEDSDTYFTTLDQMKALHAAGGMPDLGPVFPNVNSCSELLVQKYGRPYITAEDGASAPAWGEDIPMGPDNPVGLGPGRLYCYGIRGVEANKYGGTYTPLDNYSGGRNHQQLQTSYFAEVAYQFNDQFNFSLGVRRIDDEKPSAAFDRLTIPGGASFNPFNDALNAAIEEDEYYEEAYYENLGVDPLYFINSAMAFHDYFYFEHTVFNFDVEYQPAEGQFFFARAASGYRSGGANDRYDLIGGDFEPFYLFKEEELMTYEVGFKGYVDALNLRVMTSAYFYEFTNYIADAAITLTPDDPWDETYEANINYGLVEISGLDFEFVWQPAQIENLTITGFWAYNKGEVIEPYELPPYTGDNEDYDAYYFNGVFDGNKLPNNPEQKANLTAEYNIPLSSGNNLALLGVWAWTGEFEKGVDNDPDKIHDAFTRVDLRATWSSSDERTRVSLYGQNIFDDRQVQLYEQEPWELPDPVTGEEIEVIVPSPFISTYRMWGLEARFSF